MSSSKQKRNRTAARAKAAAFACAVACSPTASPTASPSSALLAAVADVQAYRHSAPVEAADAAHAADTIGTVVAASIDETPTEAGERLYPDFSMFEQIMNADAGLVDDEGVLRFPYNPIRDVACEICGVPYGEVGVGGAPEFVRSHEMHLMDRDRSGFIPAKQARVERSADLDIFDGWEESYKARLASDEAHRKVKEVCKCYACVRLRTEEGAENADAWNEFAEAHMKDKPFLQIMLAFGADADAETEDC